MSVRQEATAWNGSAWVKSAYPSNTSGHSSFTYSQLKPASSASNYFGSIPGSQPAATFTASGAPPTTGGVPAIAGDNASQVEYYSRYYQYWIDQGKASKKEASVMPPGPEKDEALRKAAWADYYATQSAHAAHY